MAAYTTINKPSLHFNTKLYSGNGGTQSITGVGFQPDLIWTKSRTNAEWHNWVDAVRGNTKNIYSSLITIALKVTFFYLTQLLNNLK